MYARVRLVTGRNPNALTVPRAAVVDIEGKRGVYVLEQDVAKFRTVETGIVDTERVEVLNGLTEGARVVTTGAVALRDGERVSVAGGREGRGGGRRGGGEAAGRRDGGPTGESAATSSAAPAEAGTGSATSAGEGRRSSRRGSAPAGGQ
jgi:hypothetical protein